METVYHVLTIGAWVVIIFAAVVGISWARST